MTPTAHRPVVVASTLDPQLITRPAEAAAVAPLRFMCLLQRNSTTGGAPDDRCSCPDLSPSDIGTRPGDDVTVARCARDARGQTIRSQQQLERSIHMDPVYGF